MSISRSSSVGNEVGWTIEMKQTRPRQVQHQRYMLERIGEADKQLTISALTPTTMGRHPNISRSCQNLGMVERWHWIRNACGRREDF